MDNGLQTAVIIFSLKIQWPMYELKIRMTDYY